MLAIAIKKTDQFDRMIRGRNWRECAAAALVAVIFGAAAYWAHSGLVRAGNLVVAASGLWIIFYTLRYGHEVPDPTPDQSLAGYQRALLRKYDHQIRLLRNVKFWYLLPPYAGLVLGSYGVIAEHRAANGPGWSNFLGPAIYTAVFAGVWWLNEVYAVGRIKRERTRLLGEIHAREGGER
jgi:hypothetical protein